MRNLIPVLILVAFCAIFAVFQNFDKKDGGYSVTQIGHPRKLELFMFISVGILLCVILYGCHSK